jgi:chemotaxis methyl-accepting protein methylase
MMEKQVINGVLTEHELSEIRALIEQRSGILFDDSRERFFSTRIREHMSEKRLAHGAELLRIMRSSNVEYDSLLERLLTQETSFFRYPAIFQALEKKSCPRCTCASSGRTRAACASGAPGAPPVRNPTRSP